MFEAWLHDDAANREARASASAAWGCFDDFGSSYHIEALRDQACGVNAARAERNRAIAASVAIIAVLGAGLIGQRYLPPGPPHNPQIADAGPSDSQMFATAKGEQRTVVLADATRIVLNTNTANSFSFQPDRRRVALLRGQAFFRVAHNAVRPFIVVVDNRSITDFGTSFEVRRSASEMRVILVDGNVSVALDMKVKPRQLF